MDINNKIMILIALLLAGLIWVIADKDKECYQKGGRYLPSEDVCIEGSVIK